MTDKRSFSRTLKSLVLAVLALRGIALSAADRNVLFIVVDDLRGNVGAYGDPLAVTPNIDALAKRGTVFLNAHCQIAICNPSRASVMTGLRPDTLEVWGLTKHFRTHTPDVVTLPQLFKQQGHITASIGKIYHGNGKGSVDEPSWSMPPLLDHVSKIDQYVLKANRTGRKAAASEKSDADDSDCIDGKVADAAIARLKEFKRRGKPFFLAVGFRKPHLPFSAPAKYWAMYNQSQFTAPANPRFPTGAPKIASHKWPEVRGYSDIPNKGPIPQETIAQTRHGYYAATSYMDAQLGRVLAALEEMHLDTNTIVALYGDHGFHLGEHDLWGKLTNFDISTRIPLLFASPTQNDKGGVVTQAVEALDLYPTLAELCKLPAPKKLEGQSLAASLDDHRSKLKNFALSQFPRPVSYNFTRAKPKNMGYSIRDDRYRYTRWVELTSGKVLAEEFYDYQTNPIETVNMIEESKYVEEITRLRALWTAQQGRTDNGE